MAKKERNLPQVGTNFTKKYKGNEYTMSVIENNGKIKYRISGRVYDSPSAAAKAVIGGKHEINGWVFWRMNNY